MLDDRSFEEAMRHGGHTAEFRARVNANRRMRAAASLAEQERVEGLRALRANRCPEYARVIAAEVSAARGVSITAILSKSHRAPFVAARDEVYYRIKTEAKVVTPTPRQIGDWLGREHTAVLAGLARHATRHGLPPVTRYDIVRKWTQARERGAARAAAREVSARP